MRPQLRFLCSALAVALCLAGCPFVTTTDGPRIPSVGDDSEAGGGVFQAGGSHSASGGTAAAEGLTEQESAADAFVWDSFAVEFPGCQEPGSAAVWRAEILRLVNVERTKAGLTPVVHDGVLQQQATQYACEMIHYGFFAHENPVTGSTLADRAQEVGYEYWALGENLAAGQPTPERAFTDWMNSPDHRANILNPAFTELGVAVRVGGEHDIYWVQEFGRPRSLEPYRAR